MNYGHRRLYGIILGYEDINGLAPRVRLHHDKLGHAPALAIALEKLKDLENKEGWLAGKSTINRARILS